ncbi:hypothetical protein GGS24DRAFT_517970 [Hypoxylon argillaceum]|nr:hypothetical protein GGS24DRAFT_517970 [Hypoxylon argillaceum]
MGIHGAKRSSSNPPCPHMRGGEVPVCWDCTEEGRIIKPPGPAEGTATPPTWQKFGRLRGSFRIGDGNRYKGTTTVSPARRTHASDTGMRLPPEAGLEVVKPDHRRSQPGLEVFVGPRTVSPEDKFIRSEPKNLGAEATPVPKYEAASNAESTVGSSTAVEPTRRIGGLRGRPCWILVVIAILALVGIVVGVAVGVTQRQAAHSSSLAKSGSGQVSNSSPSKSPMTATKTVSFYVAAAGSSTTTTFMTLSQTARSSSSSSSPSSSSSTPSTTPASATAVSISTVFVVTQPAPTTNTAQKPPPPSTPPPQPPSTPSSSSPPPASPSPAREGCLGPDQSTYADPGTGAQFRIECDVAHQGKDITNPEAATMEACVSLCAAVAHCAGAIWYDAGPQGTNLNYCWLKSAMDGVVDVTGDAQSVVRL